MVRLHCDANSGRGFAIYYAERAGRIGDKVGPSPAVLAATGPIARRFHAEFVRAMGGELTDNGLRGDDKTAVGAKYGALIGSIYSEVPTVLVELVNLKNARDGTPRDSLRAGKKPAFFSPSSSANSSLIDRVSGSRRS